MHAHLVQGLAPPRAGRPFDDETALGPDRHDHHVLDPRGLHEPEHLGTELLATVRPADPPARHLAAAQVHGLDIGGAHERLEHRDRPRQLRDESGIELEGQVKFALAVRPALKPVGAQGRLDDGQEPAQDAVLIEARDRLQGLFDLRGQTGHTGRARLAPRIETRVEEADQCAAISGCPARQSST